MSANRAGNSFNQAQFLKLSQKSIVLKDHISNRDGNDVFRFRLSRRSQFSYALKGGRQGVQVQVLNRQGHKLQPPASQRGNRQARVTILSPGTYYLRISPQTALPTSRRAYTLEVAATPLQTRPPQLATPFDPLHPSAHTPIQSDWLNTIQDRGLRSLTQTRVADGLFDRNDMIAILRHAKDGGVVDATEFSDLKKLVGSRSALLMPDYVRVLATKVVYGDGANAHYQGGKLGNLKAGSHATHLNKLIDKWFLGGDRPETPFTYQYTNGSLFQDGTHVEDIRQGGVGNCYFLATLGAVALRSPDVLQNMFIDNGDQTYTVRFFKPNGTADFVTVDRYLPATATGKFVYARQPGSQGGQLSASGNELWVALAEKAYAQVNASGWIKQDNTNSYAGISHGWSSDAIQQISGRTTTFATLDFANIIHSLNTHQLVCLTTRSNPTEVATNLVVNHEYVLTGYDATSERFSLFNPWGVNAGIGPTDSSETAAKPGLVTVNWAELAANFTLWTSTLA